MSVSARTIDRTRLVRRPPAMSSRRPSRQCALVTTHPCRQTAKNRRRTRRCLRRPLRQENALLQYPTLRIPQEGSSPGAERDPWGATHLPQKGAPFVQCGAGVPQARGSTAILFRCCFSMAICARLHTGRMACSATCIRPVSNRRRPGHGSQLPSSGTDRGRPRRWSYCVGIRTASVRKTGMPPGH